MNWNLYFILLLLIPYKLVAQISIKEFVDKSEFKTNEFLDNNDEQYFISNPKSSTKIDLNNIDFEFLDAFLFHTYNFQRDKYKKGKIKYNKTLYHILYMVIEYNKKKIKKNRKYPKRNENGIINYSFLKFDYNCTLYEVFVCKTYLLDFIKQKKFYFDEEKFKSGESKYGYFHGIKPSLTDTTTVPIEIDELSIQDFSQKFLKDFSKEMKKEKKKYQMSEGALILDFDKNKLVSNSIPMATIYLILTKKKTDLIRERR